MKANNFFSIIALAFLFVINSLGVKAESNVVIYNNVEKYDNVVSTTYFKGDSKNENLTPFKKKVNTFNEQGECISKITYVFDWNTKGWAPAEKMLYHYANGQLASVERLIWNERDNFWKEAGKTNYQHTEAGSVALSN